MHSKLAVFGLVLYNKKSHGNSLDHIVQFSVQRKDVHLKWEILFLSVALS